MTAVVVRFRRGSRLERQQLKWPLLAVVLFGVTYGVTAINSDAGIVFSVALAGIPISVAIAVLGTACTRSITSSAALSRGR